MLDQPHTSEILQQAIASDYSPLAAEKWQNTIETRAINWVALAKNAVETGLAPLLHVAINRSAANTVPDEVQTLLRQCYQETAGFNLLALNYLGEILHEASIRNIQLVLLKGVGLLHSVYGSIALRPMIDLDLLIDFEDIDRMKALLFELDFRDQNLTPSTNPSGLFWNESLFVGPDPGQVQIEIHWHLIDIPYYARKLPTNLLVERSNLTMVDGRECQILAADDQIIHLSIHNCYHHQNKLDRTLVDIAYLIHKHKDDLNWTRLFDTIRSGDVTGPVGTNISLAAGDWYAPIPVNLLTHFNNFDLPARDRFFMLCQSSEYLKIARTLFTLPGIRLKLRFIRVQLFPDKAYLAWRYGKGTDDTMIMLTLRRLASGLTGLLAELRRKFKTSAGTK